MGRIELNLKARAIDQSKYESDRNWIEKINKYKYSITKKYMAEVKNHIGIKTARKFVKMFNGLCPQVTRISFSKVIITY